MKANCMTHPGRIYRWVALTGTGRALAIMLVLLTQSQGTRLGVHTAQLRWGSREDFTIPRSMLHKRHNPTVACRSTGHVGTKNPDPSPK